MRESSILHLLCSPIERKRHADDFCLSRGVTAAIGLGRWPASQQNALEECGGMSQAGMRECLGRKAVESQTLLKRAEDDAAAALGQWDEDAKYVKLAKIKLDTSAKAFERYRKAQCALAASLGGGAIAGALELRRLACMISLNNERAASLASSITDLPRR